MLLCLVARRFLTIVFCCFCANCGVRKNYVKSIELHPHLILQRIYAHAHTTFVKTTKKSGHPLPQTHGAGYVVILLSLSIFPPSTYTHISQPKKSEC